MQIQPLLDAGYRVLAPDLRGAVGGKSYSPKDPAEYDIPTILVKDVTGTQRATCQCAQNMHRYIHI